MGAATAGASTLDESTWMQEHAWVGVVLGIVVAGLVHTGKAASRPVINAGTAGFGAPVASTAEDGVAVGIALVAIFLPLLVILVLVVLVAALVWVLSAWRRLRRRRQARLAA